MSYKSLYQKDDTGGWLLVVAGLVVLAVLTSLLHGWVLTILWGWFVTPLFDLPRLSIAQAIGLGLVLNMFIARNENGDSKVDWTAAISKAVFVPLILLAIGWVVQGFL